MECTCSVCGNKFNRKPALIKRAKHPVCSRECANVLKNTAEWVEVPCTVCGKPILRRKSRLELRMSPVCSEECKTELLRQRSTNPNLTEEDREKNRNYHPENRLFRKAVYERDNYKCVLCGEHTRDLVAHHLNGYNWDKENRYNIDNGVTLCRKCHTDFHKKYGRGNNTKEQFIEYANQSGSSLVTW